MEKAEQKRKLEEERSRMREQLNRQVEFRRRQSEDERRKDVSEFMAANAEQNRKMDLEDRFKAQKKEKMLKGGADILVQVQESKRIKETMRRDEAKQTEAERKRIEDDVKSYEAKEAAIREEKRRKLKQMTMDDRAAKQLSQRESVQAHSNTMKSS